MNLIDFNLIQEFIRGGFNAFIGGFLALPVAASFLLTALLMALMSALAAPFQALFGVGSEGMLFPLSAGLFLLLVWFIQKKMFPKLNRLQATRSRLIGLYLASEASTSCVGFKGKGVGILKKMGCDTAPGFVVNGFVFAKWIEKTTGEGFLQEIEKSGGSEEAVVQVLRKHEFPEVLVRDIQKELRRFGSGELVVRSSFPGEDGKTRSMAGVYLSVAAPSRDEFWKEAVRAVWASYFSMRAVHERKGMRAESDRFRLPILIQEKIDHSVFLVACSANPFNGREEEFAVEYETTDGANGAFVAERLTGTCRPVRGPAEPPLPRERIEQLTDALLALEARFQAPVQVEAGISGDRLVFYQVRPLTGLDAVSTFTNSYVVDLADAPLTPLTKSLFQLPGELERALLEKLRPMGYRDDGPLIVEKSGRYYLHFNRMRPWLNPHFLLRGRRLLAVWAETARLFFQGAAIGGLRKKADAAARLLHGTGEGPTLRRLQREAAAPLFRLQSRLFYLSDAASKRLDVFLKDAVPMGGPELLERASILKTPPDSAPYQAMLRELAKAKAGSGKSLGEIVERYGHWGSPEAEISARRLAEEPEVWLQRFGDPAPESGKRRREAAREIERLLRKQWGGCFFPVAVLAFRMLSGRLRNILELREIVRDRLNGAVYAAKRSALASPWGDGAFFMTLEEMEGGGASADVIEKRKAEWEFNLGRFSGPVIHDPEDALSEGWTESAIVTGLGVGTHATRGAVKKMPEPCALTGVGEGARFILVIPRPDGAFGPALGFASGLIVERGSAMSHLVLLAREKGLPVLVGAAGVMQMLNDGDWIELDAARGKARRLDGGAEETCS